MGLRRRIVGGGKRIVQSPAVMRWISDDRVMKAAEGVMDARLRVRLAWDMLKNGEGIPPVDPALDPRVHDDEARPVNSKAPAQPEVQALFNGAVATEARPVESEPVQPSKANGADSQTVARTDDKMVSSLKQRNTLQNVGGDDVLEKCRRFTAADNARKRGMYPFFRPLDLNDGPEAVINGKRVLMFGSNNYLGLTTHSKVREAAKAAIDRFGTSMTGSRLVNGSMKLHNEFEEKLAAYFGKESALVFTTGYQVNLATCAALLSNKSSVAVIDRNVHASLYDGVRLGQAMGARMTRYKHADPKSLERALQRVAPNEGALVITDGVFSAEGEIAKLDELVPIVKKYKARLFVDDAHALGVIGPGGRGTAHHFGLSDDVDLIGGTFSKSLASMGGWLVGERKTLEYIQHFAPSFMFAASAAPPNVAAAMAAFEVMQEETWRMVKLRENFTFMRDGLRELGFELGHTQTAVIPIFIRQDLRTILMWRELLEEHGVYTNPFISPGVPPKSAMLRTSYMATHERSHLERGLEAFEKVGKKYGVIK